MKFIAETCPHIIEMKVTRVMTMRIRETLPTYRLDYLGIFRCLIMKESCEISYMISWEMCYTRHITEVYAPAK